MKPFIKAFRMFQQFTQYTLYLATIYTPTHMHTHTSLSSLARPGAGDHGYLSLPSITGPHQNSNSWWAWSGHVCNALLGPPLLLASSSWAGLGSVGGVPLSAIPYGYWGSWLPLLLQRGCWCKVDRELSLFFFTFHRPPQ